MNEQQSISFSHMGRSNFILMWRTWRYRPEIWIIFHLGDYLKVLAQTFAFSACRCLLFCASSSNPTFSEFWQQEDLRKYQPDYLISVPLVYETLYRLVVWWWEVSMWHLFIMLPLWKIPICDFYFYSFFYPSILHMKLCNWNCYPYICFGVGNSLWNKFASK